MNKFKHTALKAITSNSVNICFTIVSNLILVKFLISLLGPSMYGLYAIAAAIIGISGIADIGLGNSVVKFVSQYRGRDIRNLENYVSTSFVLVISLSFIFSLFIFFISRLNIYGFLGITGEYVHAARILFGISSVIFFSTMLYSFFKAVLQGYMMYPLIALVDSVRIILLTIMGVLVVFIGGGLMGFMLVVLVLNLMSAWIFLMLFKSKLNLKINIGSFSHATLMTMLSYSIYVFLNNMFSMAYFKFDKIIVSHFLGVEELVYYQVPFTIVFLIVGINGKLLHFIFPTVSDLDKGRSDKRLSLTFISSIKLGVLFSFFLSCGAFCGGGLYMRFVLGPDFYSRSIRILFILVMAFYFSGVGIIPYFFYNGLKKPKINLYNTLAGSILYLLAAIPLTKKYGITGSAYALFAGIIPFPLYFWFIIKYTNNSYLKVFTVLLGGVSGIVLVAYLFQKIIPVLG